MFYQKVNFERWVADLVIARELNVDVSSIDFDSVFDSITKETADKLIDRLISERNTNMDRVVAEGLEKMYEKERFRKFISKDKYIAKHRNRLLAIEKSIFNELDLSDYDRAFISDNARIKFYTVLEDLREKIGSYWIDYNMILIQKFSMAGMSRSVYDRLAFRCKHLNLDFGTILDSSMNCTAFKCNQSKKMLDSCRDTFKQIKRLEREGRDF